MATRKRKVWVNLSDFPTIVKGIEFPPGVEVITGDIFTSEDLTDMDARGVALMGEVDVPFGAPEPEPETDKKSKKSAKAEKSEKE